MISHDQSPLSSTAKVNIHWLQVQSWFLIHSSIQRLSQDHVMPACACVQSYCQNWEKRKTLPAVVAIVTSHSPHLANYRVVLKGERVCVRESVKCVLLWVCACDCRRVWTSPAYKNWYLGDNEKQKWMINYNFCHQSILDKAALTHTPDKETHTPWIINTSYYPLKHSVSVLRWGPLSILMFYDFIVDELMETGTGEREILSLQEPHWWRVYRYEQRVSSGARVI